MLLLLQNFRLYYSTLALTSHISVHGFELPSLAHFFQLSVKTTVELVIDGSSRQIILISRQMSAIQEKEKPSMEHGVVSNRIQK